MINCYASDQEWLASIIYNFDLKPQVRHAAHAIVFLMREGKALTLKNVQFVMGYKNRDQARNAVKKLEGLALITTLARRGVGTKIDVPSIQEIPENRATDNPNSGHQIPEKQVTKPEKQVTENRANKNPYKDNIITTTQVEEFVEPISKTITTSTSGDGGVGEEPKTAPAKPKKPKARQRARRVPDDWVPNETTRKWARNGEIGATDKQIDFCVEAFKDFHISKGNTFVNFERAFQTWMRNQVEWGKLPGPQKQTGAKAYFGRGLK